MADKNSDYKKKHINLNDFLPEVNKGDLLDSLNKNLFNRYLTKDEFDRIVGLIGDPNPNDSVHRPITEQNTFRQNNQLQPIVSQKVGSVNHYMGFEDFLTRIERTGVDTERFDEWGNVLQFNWVPPIDLDKIVNFRDYYWDSTANSDHAIPQYIVIKNKKDWATSRYNQSLKTIIDVAPSTSVLGYVAATQTLHFAGNQQSVYVPGDHIVLYDNEGTNTLLTVATSTYNSAQGRTEITTVESFDMSHAPMSVYVAPLELPILSKTATTMVVEGNLTDLLISGYVLGVNGNPTTLLEVSESSFDTVEGNTTVVVEGSIPQSANEITLYPVISLMKGEMDRYMNESLSFPSGEWNDNMVGALIWADNREITTGYLGEFTTLGTNVLTDTTRDFLVYDIEPEDTLQILSGYKNEGLYSINSVTTTEIVTDVGQFFSGSGIGYRIFKDFSLASISQQPQTPENYDLWYDASTDRLYQFIGAWSLKYVGINKLLKLVNERTVSNYSNVNDWSSDNHWVHRSTVREFTGMMRAQMPIIEYFPFIELSETSYSSKVWRYRREEGFTYTTVDTEIEPKMFELMDFTYTGDEFEFVDALTIRFNQKYGNFVSELSPGDQIRLSGFSENDGVYTIKSLDYSQPAPFERFVSTIELESPLHNALDLDPTAESRIMPVLTTMGDPFLGLSEHHWEFGGIKDIEASSLMPEPNPMLDITIPALNSSSGDYEYFVGLNSQTYSSRVGSITNPIFEFHPSLHDLVLYDDYQEGDIRVYINGLRVYGAFEDIASPGNPDYVGGIQFINDFILSPSDVVRVELGEYAAKDIGKRAITIHTPVGDELYNLTSIRKIEQHKSDSNQYPFFALRDIYGERLTIASSIFKYAESETAPINPNVMKRIVTDGTDYSFRQELKDHDSGRMYCYYDYERIGDELQTIWKHGTYSEQYVPTKIDGQWELPNQWYYNISHENYSEIKLTELFRHFKSIIDSQEQPGLFNRNAGLFWLDDSINYGLGGTIKEHNDGFDTLVSSIFVDNGNPISVIEFARKQYDAQVEYLKERFYLNAFELFNETDDVDTVNDLNSKIIDSLINHVENNEKYDQWFGDSTSYDSKDHKGVRNWIASLPQFGLGPRFTPTIISDAANGIKKVRAHDGHEIDVLFDMGLREQFIQKIAGTSKATYPPTGTPEDGDYSIENVTQTINGRTKVVERNLYRFSSTLGVWELVDVNTIFANVILEIEKRLYDVLDESSDYGNFEPIYDVDALASTSDFKKLMELQFEAYTRDEDIQNPLLNVDTFRQNDPFTWNYYYTTVTLDPKIGGGSGYAHMGSWKALYYTVFGTAYPHLEPWVLQGYVDKPNWWDTAYADSTGGRRWQPQMWDNIFDGVIPVGFNAPSGGAGTGLPGQITERYSFLPVNTGSGETDDGYALDDILPPYWNSVNRENAADVRVRGLFDPNDPTAPQFVTTPHLNFEFGQVGFVEWDWMNSTSYQYDKLVVAYKLDPMRFMHKTFGIDYQIVSCLQISKETEKVFAHNDVNFHGDFNESETTSYSYNGLNQWYVHYNRYNGYDGVASEFRSLWRDWKTKLSYLVGAFLDTPSFSINNERFDITTKDYEIAVKRTKAIDDVWLTSLTGTVTSIPSQYSRLRDQGVGWTVEFTNNSPVTIPIEYHPVQNYSVHYDEATSTFRTYSYPLKFASISPAREYQTIEYNTPISLSFGTGLVSGTLYTLSVIFDDDVAPIIIQIDGENAKTFSELINSINQSLEGRGTISIENGNLVLQTNDNTIGSAINIVDHSIFSATDGFVKVANAQSTNNEFNKAFRIDGNFYNTFVEVDEIVIRSSSIFNGTYTIDRVFYDTNRMETVIFVDEDVSLPPFGNVDYDGFIEPVGAKTLHPEWTNGTAIVFNTTGNTPIKIDDEIPYYVIRLSDREFRISETADGAKKGVYMTNLGTPRGELFAGKINSTFTAMGGSQTSYVWRTHEIDDRYVESVPRLTISGIQQMVDFLVGYDAMTQTNGFRYKNPEGNNQDADTGRISNWQTITEKFINWLYALRNYQQETMLSYKVSANSTNNTLTMTKGSVPNWANGTQVIITPEINSTLPAEIDSPISSLIPYYVVRLSDSDTEFRIAATEYDAGKGNYITFSDNGTGNLRVQMYKPVSEYPTYELNPFKNNVWINHEFGIMSNVLDDDFVDPLYASRLYDNNLLPLTVADVLVFREDNESRISLVGDLQDRNAATPNDTTHMAGMHLFFDGFEHIISFEDYSVDNTLIYDSFLGLNTPRFYVEFDRQKNFTLRPNVGGFFLQNDSLVQNFESLVNDMRYYYDSKTAPEGRVTTDLVRKSLGYDGPKDYMSDLNINNKTQFQFWQGMIQNKGANKAVTAFVNQDTFDNAEVDEFWAYKVGEFGDSQGKDYLEMKLTPDDVVKNDLRIEFIAPDNAPLDTSFQGVALTDMDRWWKQPDQIAAMEPTQTFFFNAKITNVIENMRDDVQVIDGKYIYILDEYVDGAIVHYYDPMEEKVKILTEEVEYVFLNSRLIEFLIDPATLPPALTVSTIAVDYDSQNPAKIIDKTTGSVVTNLPIWNPAIGHYYDVAYQPVDIRRTTDPAFYTDTIDGHMQSTSAWRNNREGLVWFDCSIEQYVPYWDKKIFPDINDRIEKWGQLAEWADINLYQWTRSTVHPDEYDELVARDEHDASLTNSERHSGSVYRLLYENMHFNEDREPFWELREDIHHDFIIGLADDEVFNSLENKTADVYLNGAFHESLRFEASSSVRAYIQTLPFNAYCHVIVKAPTPTEEELRDEKFKYFTPHSIEKRFDSKAGSTYNVYYYWVKDKKEPISPKKQSVTLFTSKKQLMDMTAPYLILQGVRTPDFGYGLIFGHVFDEFHYNLPYRYTQMVAKGLHGTVKGENRYAMRFTRDFSLRDKLEKNSLSPKNLHVEWKLFREKQLEKIDRYLWNKLTEALIGHRLIDDRNIDYNYPVPSLDRVLFDRLQSSDTQYGLGKDQVLTNGAMTLQTILSVLTNPDQEFEYVVIEEFLARHKFTTIEDIVMAMDEIYLNFTTSEVNMIFFAALHDAMSLKLEHKEIFKTSWVALQISQNVNTPEPVPYDELRLVPGPPCDAEPPAPSPTPSPTSTPAVSQQPSPTPSPTPTPSASPIWCGDGEDDRVTEDGEGRITEDMECRIVEPPAASPSPTPTPTPTPSQPPVVSDNTWNVIIAGGSGGGAQE